MLKQWITGEAVIRRRLKPFNGRLSLFHHRISASDVISGMVKVSESLSLFYRALDLALRLTLFAGQGREQSLNACEQPSVDVPRIIPQELINHGRRIVSFSKM